MAFEIKKGEPIPQGRASGVASTMRKLAVGDSFVIPNATENTRKGLYSTAHHVGIRITTRKMNGDIKVWRVMDKEKPVKTASRSLPVEVKQWEKEQQVRKQVLGIDASAPEPEPDDDWIYLDKPTYEGGEILHWRRRPKGQPVIWKRESDLGV